MDKDVLYRKVGAPLAFAAVGLGLFDIVAGNKSDMLGYVSAVLFGGVFLLFHDQISKRYYDRRTNQAYVRWMVLFVGIVMVLFGIGGLLDI